MLFLGMLGFVLGVATSASAQPPSLSMDIYDVRAFLQKCPASDPVYALIRQNFELRLDDQIITTITCTEPLLEVPAGVNSEALEALQGFRLAYYMNDGTAGHLPWTSLGLYDWMVDNIAGINFKTAPGNLYCCDYFNGRPYVARSISQFSGNFPATFPFIAATLAFYGHEVRHADFGPGHTNGCPTWPLPTDPLGCDVTYDLGNLGSYGVQYLALLEMGHWLFERRDRLSGPADGQGVHGIQCAVCQWLPGPVCEQCATRGDGHSTIWRSLSAGDHDTPAEPDDRARTDGDVERRRDRSGARLPVVRRDEREHDHAGFRSHVEDLYDARAIKHDELLGACLESQRQCRIPTRRRSRSINCSPTMC